MFGDEGDHAVGVGSVADQVAGADDPLGPHDREVSPGQLQRDDVAVDVREEAEFHDEPSLDGPANSAERRAAASTASIKVARSAPRSKACSPAIVVPPGLAT